jgi:hypothetical protein
MFENFEVCLEFVFILVACCLYFSNTVQHYGTMFFNIPVAMPDVASLQLVESRRKSLGVASSGFESIQDSRLIGSYLDIWGLQRVYNMLFWGFISARF